MDTGQFLQPCAMSAINGSISVSVFDQYTSCSGFVKFENGALVVLLLFVHGGVNSNQLATDTSGI